MIRKIALAAGWLTVAIIVFATLSPIEWRPRTGHATLERFAAFFLAGTAFSIAYPRYRRLVSLALVIGAGVLEAGQLLIPGRDAHIDDAIVKAAGGVVGLTAAALIEARILAGGRDAAAAPQAPVRARQGWPEPPAEP